MTETVTNAVTRRVCGECGTSVTEHDSRCWVCGRASALADLPGDPSIGPPGVRFRFQLHSVFLTTALLALALALARHLPSLAMALVVPLATAYLRTMQIALAFGAAGQSLGIAAKIGVYLRSLGVTLLIVSAASATLIVSIGAGVGAGILVGQWYDEPLFAILGFTVSTALGVFGSLAVAAWIGTRFWPGPRPVLNADGS